MDSPCSSVGRYRHRSGSQLTIFLEEKGDRGLEVRSPSFRKRVSYLAAVSGGLLQASFLSWKSKGDEGEDLKFTDAPQLDDSTTERTR